MPTVGSGTYTYEYIQDWPKLPSGEALGVVSTVATDSQDRVYAFQRQDPPVMVFDRDGNYLNRWGIGAITDPHGMTIVDDIVYVTDRSDHVAVKFTLDGKPLQVIGDRGVHSDTGCENRAICALGPPGRSTTAPKWLPTLPATSTFPTATATPAFTASLPRGSWCSPGANPASPSRASSTCPTAC